MVVNNSLKSKKNRKSLYKDLCIYILLIIIAIICAGPFLWMFSTSFKSGQNIYDLSFIPKNPTLSNYIGVMEFMNIPRYIGNTLILTSSSIFLDVVLSALCAYALACMEFKGKKIVMTALLVSMIVPAAAGMIINYLIISKMSLLNTYVGAILPGAVKVFSIILLRQSYMAIPKELIEAARIDGAGDLCIWKKIMMPGILPAVSTVIIFDFISKWNEFLWPIIVLQDPDKYPLATALQYLNGSFNYKFGYIAAGTIISIVPVILVFIICQKNYVEAISGAIKG
ncbi:carbohydrate ABC transporter permease [Cellulosilyticum sp. ST5]|uniref:carbohydrate ABC transporter permease n=1 Tax=unclassified Cellulosilyticum TaxID=2643091 RepID=UPI000F8F6CB3|nr:carbohydrate ABC transporter permease [Cellulosilyticum sp. WCF-2]QEH70465.1 carbohydrate ABC transporter permease [Cellulosilyticum sp. WCF-2]